MTTRQQKLWTVVIVTFFSLSITTKISAQSLDITKLIGTWDWVKSEGGFVYHTITPLTEGYQLTIEFTKDSILKTFKNGQLQSEEKFFLRKGSRKICYRKAMLIQYLNGHDACLLFDKQDNLLIRPGCDDCMTPIYKKRK